MLQKLQISQKNLRNIFVCKILRILRKLKYPYSILPSSNFKTNIDCDTLISNHNIFILRRSELSKEETYQTLYNGDIVLNDDAIEDIRIANLSVNLLGGNFKNSHNKFLAVRNGSELWTGNKVYLSEYINDYKIIENKGMIFIDAKLLHNIEFPYNLPSDPTLHKEVAKFQNTIGKNRVITNIPKQTIKVIGKTYFIHSPVNLNYWHLELKTENFMEEVIENPKKNSNRRFLEQLFTNVIKLNSAPKLENAEKINKSYYTA